MIDFNDRTLPLGPARNPHVGMVFGYFMDATSSQVIDTSAASVVDMVNVYLPQEADTLLQNRVRVVK